MKDVSSLGAMTANPANLTKVYSGGWSLFEALMKAFK